MIIFNSPHNPTGGVLTDEDLQAIADVARENDIIVMADEIYGRLVYEGEHISIAALPEHGRADDRPRRLLQGLRDDRLAAWATRSCRRASSTRSAS